MSKLTIPLLAAVAFALAGCATQGASPPVNTAAKRDADYNLAVQKCDNLSVAERSACIYDARTRFGKS